MQRMDDDVVDLVVTSPPYDQLRVYNGYNFDYKSTISQLYRVVKPGGVVVWIVADQTVDGSETGSSFNHALFARAVGFNLHDTMIYLASGTGAKGSRLAYWQGFEYMFVWSKGRPATFNPIEDRPSRWAGAKTSGRRRRNPDGSPKETAVRTIGEYGRRTNVWRPKQDYDSGGHPATFPLSLAVDHIRSWSNPGDVVLDPMVGSGTTAVAAIETGRNFIAFDISDEYVDIAMKKTNYARVPLPGLV